MITLRTNIRAPDGKLYEFHAQAFRSKSPAGRMIDQAFYEEHCDGGFADRHYEMLLVTDVSRLPNEKEIHFHRTPGGQCFVCWTGQLRDSEITRRIFTMWCVGTAYTIHTGKDFAPLYEESRDPEKVIEELAKQSFHIVTNPR